MTPTTTSSPVNVVIASSWAGAVLASDCGARYCSLYITVWLGVVEVGDGASTPALRVALCLGPGTVFIVGATRAVRCQNRFFMAKVWPGHYPTSDPHRHYDVPVLVLFTFGGTHLAGGLSVFEFEFDLAAARGL